MFSPRLNSIVSLPTEPWKYEYEQAGIDIFGQDLSHVDHPHTGKGIIGLNVKIKVYDGNLIETQVQLTTWIAGLVSWDLTSRCGPAENASNTCTPPPIVGCTIVRQDWKFYIVYGIAGSSNQFFLKWCV